MVFVQVIVYINFNWQECQVLILNLLFWIHIIKEFPNIEWYCEKEELIILLDNFQKVNKEKREILNQKK